MAVQHKSEGSLGPEQWEGRGRWSRAAGRAESRPSVIERSLEPGQWAADGLFFGAFAPLNHKRQGLWQTSEATPGEPLAWKRFG